MSKKLIGILLFVLAILSIAPEITAQKVSQKRIENNLLPDLTIEFETTGDPGTYNFIVSNIGDADTNPPWVTRVTFFLPHEYYRLMNGEITEDEALFFRLTYCINNGILPQGEQIVFHCCYPFTWWPTICYVWGRVDIYDTVAESDETNNEFLFLLVLETPIATQNMQSMKLASRIEVEEVSSFTQVDVLFN